MNCFNHDTVVAVAQCVKCGVGLCSNCVKNSEYTLDDKPLCRTCNQSLIKKLLGDDRKLKTWTIVKLAVNAFFLTLGLVIWLSSGNIANAIIFFAIGGIPTAWKMLARDDTDRIRDSIYDAATEIRDGAGSSFGNSIFRFIFRIIFTFIIGAIASPILLIINIVKLIKCGKRITQNELLLANFEY